ncbi:hypothetical protein J6590_063667 [Homalodisca vitripennis]|nr:hypothetical protein J6590_063667 [Homalodisca vitripennis]
MLDVNPGWLVSNPPPSRAARPYLHSKHRAEDYFFTSARLAQLFLAGLKILRRAIAPPRRAIAG